VFPLAEGLSFLVLLSLAPQDGGIRKLAPGDSSQVAWSPDGKLMAWVPYLARDSSVPLWDVKTGKVLRRISAGETVAKIAFSPDSKILATAEGPRRTIRLWDVGTGKPLKELAMPKSDDPGMGYADHVTFSADGKLVIGAGNADVIPIWDAKQGTLLKTIRTEDSAFDLAISPDSKWVAYCTMWAMKTWSVDTGERFSEFVDPAFPVTGGVAGAGRMAFSPTRYLLALATSRHEKKNGENAFERRVEVWDFQKKSVLFVLRFPAGAFHSYHLAFSPDGESLAALNNDGRVALWDVATQKELRSFAIDNVRAFAFAPDGNSLAITSKEGVSLVSMKPPARK
jgi:WD40 repeat protein